jgi:hypothetical protein
MWTLNLRIGWPEFLLAGSLAFLAGLVVLFILEWPVGLIPAGTYAITSVGAYAGFRQSSREQERQRAEERAPTRFRIVGGVGTCPLGLRTGQEVAVPAIGSPTPMICAEAEAVLRMAAADGQVVRQWCCPVYDHMLVFEKEAVAA